MREPTWPRDYHKKADHKWYNNRHGLDAYYLRHDGTRQNTWKKKRSVRFMTIATLLVMAVIFCIFLAAHYVGRSQTVSHNMPATEMEKENALHHVVAAVSTDEMNLYNYYVERSR
jgi:hypothetical protein